MQSQMVLVQDGRFLRSEKAKPKHPVMCIDVQLRLMYVEIAVIALSTNIH